MGLWPLVLSATSPYATLLPVAMLPIRNRFLTCTMLNMRLAQGKQLRQRQQHSCDFLSSVTKTQLKCQKGHPEWLKYGKITPAVGPSGLHSRPLD